MGHYPPSPITSTPLFLRSFLFWVFYDIIQHVHFYAFFTHNFFLNLSNNSFYNMSTDFREGGGYFLWGREFLFNTRFYDRFYAWIFCVFFLMKILDIIFFVFKFSTRTFFCVLMHTFFVLNFLHAHFFACLCILFFVFMQY